MSIEDLFYKVKNYEFDEFKSEVNSDKFYEDEFWSLMLNNEDDELIKKLSIYCNGDIGLDFEYGIFRLFNNSKINGEQCYRALSLGKELGLIDEDEFNDDMEEEFYQILRFGDRAFKIIVFFIENKIDFHSDIALYAAVESGGERIVDLLLKSIDYDSEILGQSLNYVYHNNGIDKGVSTSIFRKILSLSPSLEFNDSEFESHFLSCLFTYSYLFETLWDFYPDAQDLNSFEYWEDVLGSLNEEEISNLSTNIYKIKGCFNSDKLLLATRNEKYKEIADIFE